MPFKWLLFVLVLWFSLGFFGGAVNGVSVDGQQTSTLMLFMRPLTQSTAIPLVGNVVAAVTDPGWWNAAVQMATFDFPSIFPYNSDWQLVRWGIFMLIGAAFMITLTLAIFRGTPSS
jgi:hypothetical protein